MSGLIKHTLADATVDRLPLGQPRVAAPPPRDPRIDALEARVAELEQLIAAERRQAERAVASARDAGRGEIVADDTRRIDLLERGIADAVAAWRDRLAGIDGLAAALAAAALAKMFGDSPDLAALTARTLAHHLERLDRHAIVSVGVSLADFPDHAALTALAGRTGLAPACVTARAELPAGACRVALKLGEVELDPLGQWAAIEHALDEMGAAA